MTSLLLLAVLAAAPAAPETIAVLAVSDPPAGPDAELAEMAHQLRAACRERVSGVQEPTQMRARLLGESSGATLPELERAYAGARAVYQNGDYESAIRTLEAIAADLERLPASREVHERWVRAVLKLAHAQATVGRIADAQASMEKVIVLDSRHALDPDQYSPSYRRRFEEARARVKARPKRKLTITAAGVGSAVFVNARPVGTAPVTVSLPEGRYRVSGAAGTLRVPSIPVDLVGDDREVTLDFALAAALRPNAGPGLALPAADRAAGLVRAAAWLGVDRLLAVSAAREGEASFLVGSIYDVRRGALEREGRVRASAGSVPPASLGALAAFLLTGQPQPEVVETAPASGVPYSKLDPARKTPAPPAALASAAAVETAVAPAGPLARAPPRWMRPVAWGAGALTAALAGIAVYEGLAARASYRDASTMIGEGGAFVAGADALRYEQARADGDSASRAAYASAGAAILCAAAAGVLGYLSREPAAPALRF